MYKIKCPVCKGTNTVKNGKRNGVQLYICIDCPYQFRNRKEVNGDKLWSDYQDRKQTISELADARGISQSTVKRRLRDVEREWVQPALLGSGFVHLDTTYWGHNWGVLLAIDEVAGSPLYVAFISHEEVQDYKDAVSGIEARGYHIKGIVIDGMKSLFEEFSAYKIQMCQFHMKQIVRRYLTKRPRLIAARELKNLVDSLACRQEKGGFRGRIPTMESPMGRNAEQAFHTAVREDTVHTEKASFRHAQR